MEACIDVKDLTGDRVADIGEEVEGRAGDAFHPRVFLEQRHVAARAHQRLAALDASERQRAHGACAGGLLAEALAQGKHIIAEKPIAAIPGGLKIGEPAADMGMALAIASSFRNSPLHRSMVAIGEVGLSGEIRGIPQASLRVREASQMGFTRIVLPAANADPSDPALAASAAAVTRSSAVAPSCTICTGFSRPSKTGPTTVPPPISCNSFDLPFPSLDLRRSVRSIGWAGMIVIFLQIITFTCILS